MINTDELRAAVDKIFRERWDDSRQGTTVPFPEDLRLNQNHGIKLDACVLYADMADSTGLVDNYLPAFAAEIYKAYMLCAGKFIKDAGGEITAYDGDRVMAIFLGSEKERAAVKAARRIHYALSQVLWPALSADYPGITYRPNHTIGIDASPLLAARIGVRGGGDNDIVWVGHAANHAAKLCADDLPNAIRITHAVFQRLHAGLLIADTRGAIWTYHGRTASGVDAYSTDWWMAPEFNP
ncbi:adenylate/guanylate cyclase domain-containing protein [Dyella sp.]|uniref:adenylate/guanylate cyclase domain-containing protein n=1 Tax=Dyella sp. TaxID=1869338 RepID=UPI003F8009CB